MTEVLQSSPPHHFPSPSSSTSSPCVVVSTNDVDIPNQHQQQQQHTHNRPHEILDQEEESKEREREGDQVSIVELLVAAFRRSIVGCSVTASTGSKELCKMEIGVPTNVRHVAHVTFDRFNGFLGLPVEFEPEVPRRAPSASATVFGVSTESMQLSYDSRGNSVPTILLMMQRQLYAQGGLQAEGIFRITAGNSQEEYVRDQLNRGVIPDGVDAHCLAGLIKAWFRELPTSVLDSLSPEQVMQCQSEEECARLAGLLPPTEAALLDWAINLMADVAQMEHMNKMNARNVAMVFAPNMTQMSDPLTALMYAVQVMNFLKYLIIRMLRERDESLIDSVPVSRLEPNDGNGNQSASQPSCDEDEDATQENEWEKAFIAEEPAFESPSPPSQDDSSTMDGSASFLSSIENIPGGRRSLVDNCPCEVVSQVNALKNEHHEGGHTYITGGVQARSCKSKTGQSSNSSLKRGSKKVKEQPIVRAAGPVEKGKGTGIVDQINPRTELFEAWR
ncbi:rho GTPase-activating protein [Salix suchowensis]|nr:rho GTPase-activating protein [Salix suchowensis]